MNRFLLIVRCELRRMLRARFLLPLWLAFAALCAYAAWNGAAWSAARWQAVDAILAEERATHASRRAQIVNELTPQNKSFYGGAIYPTAMALRATLAPGRLSVLTVGQTEGYPMAANIYPFIASNTIHDEYMAGMENPSVLAAGRFDLAFVLVWLLPLLVLAGSFDLLAGERERGLAPWLLSQPVAPARLLAAKAAARALLVIAPLVAILLATLWWSAPPPTAPLLQDALLQDALLVTLLVTLYALFWLALAAGVNLFARNAAQAALGCVAGWLLLVVLVPGLALGVADLAAPPSSPTERVNALRAQAMQARAEVRAQVASAATAAPRDPPPNIPDKLRQREREVARGEQLIRQALAPFRARDARRHAWLDRLRALSPAIALQDALERLAGADAARAIRFQHQAHAFLLEVRALTGRYMEQDRLLTAADYDRGFPRFVFAEARGAERLRPLMADASAIVLPTLALLWFARRRLRRPTFTD